MLLKEGDNFDKVLDFILEAWQGVLNNTINKLLMQIRERPLIKIHEWDTWSVDYTLNLIIHPLLVQLKETQHGYPFTEYCDAPPEYIKPEQCEDVYRTEKGSYNLERWLYILDEMIYAFDIKQEPDIENYDFKYNLPKLGGKEGNTHPPAVTNEKEKQRYERDVKDWEERIQEGYRLFGKYYTALWD